MVKINGNFTVPGGQTVSITGASGTDTYVIFWVTGSYTTSGSGLINQAPGVHAIWYVDNDITTSGGSYNNQDGLASEVSFIGVGTVANNYKVTVSGSANFIGTINAPNFDVTVSGTGNFSGAIIAESLNISGGASFHYDEALSINGDVTLVGNYAYASWFEDNSDPARGIIY
jgi:hypothetical protein